MLNFYGFCTNKLDLSYLESDLKVMSDHLQWSTHNFHKLSINIIKRNSENAYWYSLVVLKRRWPEAEPYIMKDVDWSFLYARDIIKGRWPEAEKIIMVHPARAFWYAREVIKGRWPEGEGRIKTDDFLWKRYCRAHNIWSCFKIKGLYD